MSLESKKKEIFPEAKRVESRYEDNRYAGKTVNKVRQQQRKDLIINSIMKNAKTKQKMGMELSPEEQWILQNRELFL